MRDSELQEEILRLKKEKNAVILAHYYQEDEIQEIADFIGDSLDLSRKAKAADGDIIVFSGVKFMGEVAKILNPSKKVIIPDMKAGCSLEESCRYEQFKAFRQKHPEHVAITYINCSAEIKSISDIICTSSNAHKIINSVPEDKPILFAPDRNLGAYLSRVTGREMLLWDGACVIHENFSMKSLVTLQNRHPNAPVIAHPECTSDLLEKADFIGSTSALIKYSVDHKEVNEFIVMTEPGILYKMKKERPDAKFYDVQGIDRKNVECTHCNSCHFMKMNTLEKLYDCLLNETNEIFIPDEIHADACKSLDRMLELS